MNRWLCAGLVASATMALGADVLAQQAPRDDNAVAREHANDVSTEEFRAPHAAETTNVGSGTASTTATGPVGELRGSTGGPDAITGPIGPADVARLMVAQMPRLQPCYDAARATRPHFAGRIEVRFTIGRDGHVTQAAAAGMSEAPDVATCIANVLRQTVFPQPATAPLPFIYPLTFSPPPTARDGRAVARRAQGPARH